MKQLQSKDDRRTPLKNATELLITFRTALLSVKRNKSNGQTGPSQEIRVTN